MKTFKELIEENFGSIENLNKYAKDKNKIIELERIETDKENDKLYIGYGLSSLEKIDKDMKNLVFENLDDIDNGKCKGWFIDNVVNIMTIEDLPVVLSLPYTSIEEVKNNLSVQINDKERITHITDYNIENIYDNKNRLIQQVYDNYYNKVKLYTDDNNLTICVNTNLTNRITNISNGENFTIHKNMVYSMYKDILHQPSISTYTYFKDSEGRYRYAIMKNDIDEYPNTLTLINDYIIIGDEIFLTDAKSIILLNN